MKGRKLLVIAAASCALLAGAYYFFNMAAEPKEAAAVAKPAMPEVNELPELVLHMADQSTVYMRDLSGDIMIIFFNPDCEHCQDHAREMAANKSVFANWQVYFITSMDAKAAEDFAVNYRLNEPNYKFGNSLVPEVYNAVGPLTEVPTIMIYKSSKLIKKFVGPTSIDQLREVL